MFVPKGIVSLSFFITDRCAPYLKDKPSLQQSGTEIFPVLAFEPGSGCYGTHMQMRSLAEQLHPSQGSPLESLYFWSREMAFFFKIT